MRHTNDYWVKGFARNCGTLDNVSAEMWASRDGLLLAKELKITSLIVEFDALVVHLMNNSIVKFSLEPLPIDYRNFFKTFLTCKLSTHTK